jgi:N utilization substance protein B
VRSRAREIALQVLFQTEFRDNSPDASLDLHFNLYEERDKESLDYARLLAEGVRRHLVEIDGLIEEFSHHWKLARMALVDRNILRVAVFELLHGRDLTTATIIDEAVELAKKFGQKDSGAFINGILDSIAKKRRDEQRASS